MYSCSFISVDIDRFSARLELLFWKKTYTSTEIVLLIQ